MYRSTEVQSPIAAENLELLQKFVPWWMLMTLIEPLIKFQVLFHHFHLLDQ